MYIGLVMGGELYDNFNIVYILGPGRSGSTVLEVLLSNSSQLIGVGEITHLFRDGYIDAKPCSCGNSINVCPLWGAVSQGLNLQESAYKHTADVMQEIDWHSNFFNALKQQHSEQSWVYYSKINKNIFSTLNKAQPNKYLIDASKYPARALNLKKLFPGKVKVICITRSPEGLMNSFAKPDIEQESKCPAFVARSR